MKKLAITFAVVAITVFAVGSQQGQGQFQSGGEAASFTASGDGHVGESGANEQPVQGELVLHQ